MPAIGSGEGGGFRDLVAERADNSGVVHNDDVGTVAIIQGMDDARANLRRLLTIADTDTLSRRSNGTRWTNEQLLCHMVFGYMVVRALLILVQIFGRLHRRSVGVSPRC